MRYNFTRETAYPSKKAVVKEFRRSFRKPLDRKWAGKRIGIGRPSTVIKGEDIDRTRDDYIRHKEKVLDNYEQQRTNPKSKRKSAKTIVDEMDGQMKGVQRKPMISLEPRHWSGAQCEDEENGEGPIHEATRLHSKLKDKGAPKPLLRRSRSKIQSARRAVKEAREANRAKRDLTDGANTDTNTLNPKLRTKKAVLEQIGFNDGWGQMTPENKRIERSIQRNSHNKMQRARKARKGKK